MLEQKPAWNTKAGFNIINFKIYTLKQGVVNSVIIFWQTTNKKNRRKLMFSPLNSKRQRADMPKLDRRNFQRVKVNTLGRYMLANKQEFPCQVRDMSPGNLALSGPVAGGIDEVVIVYIDHIGRVEGKIMRVFDGGFAMSINATKRKREKLAAQLTWLANRHTLNLPEDRRHGREAPTNSSTKVTLDNGQELNAKILDMSLSGAALSFDVKVEIGTLLMVGKIRSRVVRVFEEGVAVEFAKVRADKPK